MEEGYPVVCGGVEACAGGVVFEVEVWFVGGVVGGDG